MSTNRHASPIMSFIQSRNKSMEDVADALGVSVRAVFYWTSGQREPRFTVKQIQALCTLLECSVHELPPDFGPNKNAEA